MKKSLAGSVIVLLVLFLSMGLGFAGNGKGAVNGAGDGSGPIHDIINDGTYFEYTGTVVSYVQGGGMEFDIDGEQDIDNIVIYGIGPVRYWDSIDVPRPAVGESVTVIGYEVDYNGVLRNIAISITLSDGAVVDLRDPVTGVPLWRQAGRK